MVMRNTAFTKSC